MQSNPPDLFARALTGAFNRALDLDPEARTRLKPLAGRAVALQLEPGGTLRVAIDADCRIQVQLESADPAELTIRTSPGAVLKLLATGSAGIGQLKIEGDAELARELQRLAKVFEPDVEGLFVRGFGEVLGFQLARVARDLGGWVRNGARRLAEQSAEYLREESRDLVAPGELDQFLDEVDEVRAGVERAERRLERLLAARSSANRR